MSLVCDDFFFQALKGCDAVSAVVGERIYNPAVPVPDEDLDSVVVPYMVISLDSVSNADGDKDEVGESDEDTAVVSILVVAETRKALAKLACLVRDAIRDYYENADWDAEEEGYYIADYVFSASGVELDPYKGCVFQTLNYNCVTNKF